MNDLLSCFCRKLERAYAILVQGVMQAEAVEPDKDMWSDGSAKFMHEARSRRDEYAARIQVRRRSAYTYSIVKRG